MNFLEALDEEHIKILLKAANEISAASNSGRKLQFISSKELNELKDKLESELSKRNNADDTIAE